ncbi:uncharacterized protein LOC110338455 [Mus pahari]|uniref:uncharacterized protein LOC110338455 n=1 Tax=Mus pahari TaxID=10093 RepID=UPI000A30B4F9|nr:uncharacterized protein LOC110338455 [Mus pahari]
MLVRSPRQRFSVASSRWIGAAGPRGTRGTAQQTPRRRCAWLRHPQAPGCAWAPARVSRITAPLADTRQWTLRRLPSEPLLRLGQKPALTRRGPPEGRGDTATDTCLQGSAPARAALGAGPPPRRRVGGDARASQPGSSSCSSSSPAKPGHPLPWVPAPVPQGQSARLGDCASLALPEEGSWLPGDILHPRSDQVVALGAEAPCAPGGLSSSTGFSTGLFPASAAASGHAHPRDQTKKRSCYYGGPEYPPRKEVTFPGLPSARPLPPQRHAWPRRRGNSTDAQRMGVPDDRVMSSRLKQARLRDLEGQGQQSSLCQLQQRPICPLFWIKSPQWQALFAKVAVFLIFHSLLFPPDAHNSLILLLSPCLCGAHTQ